MENKALSMSLRKATIHSIAAERSLERPDSSIQPKAEVRMAIRSLGREDKSLMVIYSYTLDIKPTEVVKLGLQVLAQYDCIGCEGKPDEVLVQEALKDLYGVHAVAALAIGQITQSMGLPPLIIPFSDEPDKISGLPESESSTVEKEHL